MSIVEALFRQPIPVELWHYTTIEGFEGMVSSGTIWASEVHSSRDQTEFVHVREVAKSYLAGLHPIDEHAKLGIQAANDFMTEDFDAGWLSPHKTEIFIASFSSAPDRKSQWVDYSNRGQGVAVVLDLTNVRPSAESGSLVTLAPCVYDPLEKERLTEHALRHVIEAISESSRRVDDRIWVTHKMKTWKDEFPFKRFDQQTFQMKLMNDLQSLFRDAKVHLSIDLFRLASHCKHHSYFEELEWRLALPHTKSQPFVYSRVEYRGHIPYVAHRISGQSKLPILRVVTGFACKEMDRVKAALAKNGYAVHVTTSDVPERR